MDSPKKPQERDSIFLKCKNAKKGMLSSVELSVYFEKHKILEIITKILFEISRERPGNVAKWLYENIHRIANEFVCSRTFLLMPNNFDLDKFSQFYEKKYHIPTIVYKSNGCKCSKEILNKLELFLKKHNLNEKNKIFINFPENCKQLRAFQENSITPSNIFEVRSDPRSVGSNTCCILEDFVKKQNNEAISGFYKDIYKIIHYGSRETAPNRLQTVEEIAMNLSHLMEFSNIPKDRLLNSGFRYRIILYGTRGSGQKTHALSIAKRFNLVLLSAAQIIESHMDKQNGIGNALRNRFHDNDEISLLSEAAAIQTRILQNDCIQHGWILIDYPYSKEGFKVIMERQIMPPNRTIILHCRKRLALRRLQKKWDQKYSNNYMTLKSYMKYIEAEMNYLVLQKFEVVTYLSKLDIPLIHINANHSFKTVQKEIWGKLEQNQCKIFSTNTGRDICFTNEII